MSVSFYSNLSEAFIDGVLASEDCVRALLWEEHPECCGHPVIGAEYGGMQESVCCGCPEPALLSDAQIVSSLRALFPDIRKEKAK